MDENQTFDGGQTIDNDRIITRATNPIRNVPAW